MGKFQVLKDLYEMGTNYAVKHQEFTKKIPTMITERLIV